MLEADLAGEGAPGAANWIAASQTDERFAAVKYDPLLLDSGTLVPVERLPFFPKPRQPPRASYTTCLLPIAKPHPPILVQPVNSPFTPLASRDNLKLLELRHEAR
jgi:hypothetical protein